MQLMVRALVDRFEDDGSDGVILAIGGFEVRWPRDLLPPHVTPTDIVEITVRRDDDAVRQLRSAKVGVRANGE